MTRRGRKPDLLGVIDRLGGSEFAKKRLGEILRHTVEGKTAQEAADEMGISLSRFHELQSEALQGAVEALEPKPAGRRRRVDPIPREVAEELEDAKAAIQHLQWQVEAAKVREATSLIFGGDLKKTRRPKSTVNDGKGTDTAGNSSGDRASSKRGR